MLAGGTLAVFDTQASADTHVTVRSGDTMSNLATAYDSSVDQIAQKNNISKDSTLQIGQELDIPNDRPDEWVGIDRSTADFTKLAQAGFSTDIWGNVTDSITNFGNDAVVQNANSNSSDVNNVGNVNPNGNVSTANTNSAVTTQTGTSGAVNTTSYNNYTPSTASYSSNANTVSTAAYSAPVVASTSASSNANTQYSPAEAVSRAQEQIGTPYVWGGNRPGGFDCSGLVQWAYGLPASERTTYQQQTMGTHRYDVENAQAGDIYFWGSDAAPHHEALATGNGNYIQAPQPGQNVQNGNINAYRPNYFVSMQ